MFPVTRRFKGGKGVATAGGMLLVLYPVIVLILGVVWFLVARVLKLASVGVAAVRGALPGAGRGRRLRRRGGRR